MVWYIYLLIYQKKSNHSCRCIYTMHGWYAIVLLEAGYLFASYRVGRLPVFLRGWKIFLEDHLHRHGICRPKRRGFMMDIIWVVVSMNFYFHPYLWKVPILTHIFQRGLKPPTSFFSRWEKHKNCRKSLTKTRRVGAGLGRLESCAVLAVGPRGLGGCSPNRRRAITHSVVSND